MILTVTLNAAMDVTYEVDLLELGETHRIKRVHTQAGGKGLNVARVLHALGHDVMVTGLAGGPTGAAIRADLAAACLPETLAPIAGTSRRTVTIVDNSGATGLHEPGPRVSAAEWAAFCAVYADLAVTASVVVLSGSLPPGLPADAYAELVRLAPDAVSIVDAEGVPLEAALAARPDVVKANRAELLSSTGKYRPLAGAVTLRENGARAVIGTIDAEGLLALTPDGDWEAGLEIPLDGNPTGAGDACVAAIAAGLADRTPWPKLLVEAVALAGSSVVCPVAGAVDLDVYRRLRDEVVVKELDARADR
jgi:tagatose 6-phosphate kinase